MTTIKLECDWEPSWDDAKTRLKVAGEVFGFPFYIAMDEVAYAYKDVKDYISSNEISDPIMVILAEEWFKDFARQVTDYESGLRILYPWFHEGEEMP
jgi:hypothetical protein